MFCISYKHFLGWFLLITKILEDEIFCPINLSEVTACRLRLYYFFLLNNSIWIWKQQIDHVQSIQDQKKTENFFPSHLVIQKVMISVRFYTWIVILCRIIIIAPDI